MDPENRMRIEKCWDELVTSLDFDLMSPCLIQYNIINTQEYDSIKVKQNKTEKVNGFKAQCNVVW